MSWPHADPLGPLDAPVAIAGEIAVSRQVNVMVGQKKRVSGHHDSGGAALRDNTLYGASFQGDHDRESSRGVAGIAFYESPRA